MRLLENFTGFLLDVQEPLQSLHEQRGDMIDLTVKETTIGARGSARLHGKAFGEPQHIEFGYFARGDVVSGIQQRDAAATGHPYLTEANLDSNLGDIGLYADADVKLLHWLSIRGGVRSDLVSYHSLFHVLPIRQAKMLFWRHITEHGRTVPSDHRSSNRTRQMIVTRSNIGG